MTAIKQIRVHRISIPLNRPFAISRAVHQAQSLVVVEVETCQVVGLGETQFVPGFSTCTEDAKTVSHVIKDILAPQVIGQEVLGFRHVSDIIHGSVPGHTYAKAALADAVVDAAARELDVPLFQLLGGSPVPLKVGRPIGVSSTEQTLQDVATALESGIDEVKIKIGGRSRADDLMTVRAVRETFNESVIIRVDGNAGLELQDAAWLLPRLSELDLQLIEEPIRSPSPFTWRRTRDLVPDVLMADESVGSFIDALAVIRGGWVDAVAIKLAKMGGFVVTSDLTRYLQNAGILVFGASQPASSIGVANMAHLMCAVGNFSYSGEFHMGALQNFDGDIVKQPLPLRQGWVEVFQDRSGNGMELDMSAVRHYSLGTDQINERTGA